MNKTIGFLRKLQNLQSYKALVRPHLSYKDIPYDLTYNNSFHRKLESIQYNACLALSGAVRGFFEKKYIKNSVLSPFEFVVGAENFAFFIKS